MNHDSDDDVPPLGEVFDVIRAVWGVNRGLELLSRRMLDVLGVSGPQRLAIRMIGRFPGITAQKLTRILHIDPSTVSSLLKRLEDRGLIARDEDPRDRRRSPIVLTAVGRGLDVPAAGTVEAAVQDVLRQFPRRDVAAATKVMHALADALVHASV